MLRACALLHRPRLQMGGCEVGWSKLLWPGPVPSCSHPRRGSRGRWRGQSLGRGCSLVGAASPSMNTFPNPTALGQGSAHLRLLGSGDYRSELQSMLQTWLIAGWGSWASRPTPPACTPGAAGLTWGWHFQPGARSPAVAARSFWLLARTTFGSSEEGPPRLQLRLPPSRLRRGHLLPRGQSRIGQVETSPFKRARANQGPARRPIQTRAAAGLALPPPGHWRGAGAGEPAASVTGEQHRRLGLQAVLAGRSGAAMERSLHRVSLGSRRAHPDLAFYLTTFETRFAPLEFPLSNTVLLLHLEISSILFPLAQGQDRCGRSLGGLGSLWAHLGSCSVTAPVDI
ncbi:uncharacterized protein LOC117800926 isoform X2 [Ailuropoda melanoleuca]|nr:uncharacterized protein LOC117800926 isoform X2 [Ailuropoda melanoleuca]